MTGAHRAGRAAPDLDDGASVLVATPDDMVDLGRRLARLLRPGDLVVLTGDLGAGKTTLTRGLGEGLGVRGAVTSPTFVIAREHPSTSGGPALVHVDAYRLTSLAEVDDLDLDASLADSVTVVEWGEGLVEELSGDRLEVRLQRPHGDAHGPGGADADPVAEIDPVPEVDPVPGADPAADRDEPRTVHLEGVGPRWVDVALPGTPGAG